MKRHGTHTSRRVLALTVLGLALLGTWRATEADPTDASSPRPGSGGATASWGLARAALPAAPSTVTPSTVTQPAVTQPAVTQPAARPHEAHDAEKALLGLWHLVPPAEEPLPEDVIRFYYFHPGGIGLYRFGRTGFNQTHSFDWRREGGQIELLFRKTGAAHDVPISWEEDGRVLVLHEDPREPGVGRYRKAEAAPDAAAVPLFLSAGDGGIAMDDDAPLPSPAGQMWIWAERYATGGMAFSIYQFAPASLDGRGVGWHHRGDFDDWSTETLHYRVQDGTLQLRFERSGETHETSFRLSSSPPVTLELRSDPRNAWQRARFVHMGRSF